MSCKLTRFNKQADLFIQHLLEIVQRVSPRRTRHERKISLVPTEARSIDWIDCKTAVNEEASVALDRRDERSIGFAPKRLRRDWLHADGNEHRKRNERVKTDPATMRIEFK